MSERIVAIGLLSGRDLEMLGRQFTRYFPVEESGDLFADLLAKLDAVASSPDASKEQSSEGQTG